MYPTILCNLFMLKIENKSIMYVQVFGCLYYDLSVLSKNLRQSR